MEQQTKLIAERLRWARINADVSPETLASACGVTVEEYLELEKGEKDFYFNFLYNCALTLQMTSRSWSPVQTPNWASSPSPVREAVCPSARETASTTVTWRPS